MAIQKPNSRRLLNKDEEDERKASEKFFLPTLEELTAIEEKAKEDAAAAVSSQMADPMRNRNDLGRVAMQDAMREMLAVKEQKQRVESAQRDYDAYPWYDKIGVGTSSIMADIARDNVKKQQSTYDRMRMTEKEYEKRHKADFGETVDRIATAVGHGAAKSLAQTADVISATGAGIKAAAKSHLNGNDDPMVLDRAYKTAYQAALTNGKSYYDEADAEYRREMQYKEENEGELNAFTSYIADTAHSIGEQSVMYWSAAMGGGIFAGKGIFGTIASKADDLIKSGKWGLKMLGQALKKFNPASVAGAAYMFATSNAQSTKEAVNDMEAINAERAENGLPKKYSNEEIIEKASTYGFLNAVSEVGLENLLTDAFGAAKGLLPKGIQKAANPLWTIAKRFFIDPSGESIEEGAQYLASTGLKDAVYDAGAEVDPKELRDVMIVGYMSGFIMQVPTNIQTTSLGVSAMSDVARTAKATERVTTDEQAGVVAATAAVKAKAYGQIAENVRKAEAEGADAVSDIYEWAAGRQQEIADAMADDTKRKKIIEENTKDTRAAIQRMRDTNPDFAETERTGLASGANVDDIRMAGELSSVLGKKVRFFREDAKNGTINNGEYHEDTGEIWINTRSKNVKAQIVAHELTHSIEKKDGYQKLVDLTMNKLEAEQKAKGKTLDDLYREKETLYADGGVRLASYDEITSELVAEYVEKRLLTDEASIKSLVSENRTLGQRIREWFDSLLAKMGNASAKEREYIRQMRDMYARALWEDVSQKKSTDDTLSSEKAADDTLSWEKAADDVEKALSGLKQQGVNRNEKIKGNEKYNDLKDSRGNDLSEEQREFFKESKMRDRDGKLQVMLHGTQSAGFHTFNRGAKSKSGGIYFTDSALNAGSYSGTFYEYAPSVSEHMDEDAFMRMEDAGSANYAVYLDIKNPLVVDAGNRQWNELVKPGSDGIENSSTSEYEEYAKENGYDGVIIRHIKDEGIYGDLREYDPMFEEVFGEDGAPDIVSTVAIVFDPNQIKSIENKKPTEDDDIRHSVSRVDDQRYKEAVDQGDMETAARMVKDAAAAEGYTEDLYHGTQKFGFTELDVTYSDDGMSFFATPDLQTAQTYSGNTELREIKDGAALDGSGNYHFYGNTDGFLIVDGGGVSWNHIKPEAIPDEKIRKWIEKTAKKDLDRVQAENKKNKAQEDKLRAEEKSLKKAYDEVVKKIIAHQEAAPHLYPNAPGLTDARKQEIRQSYRKTEPLSVKKADKLDALKAEILQRRINNDNQQAELFAKGRFLMEEERRLRAGELNTRAVARFAKDSGYTGVLVKSIYDDGGRGQKRQGVPQDIYNFFDPARQLKSADPVTYDNDGKVIPLSERFKRDNDDIRHSVSREDASVTEAETDQTLQQIRNDIAADEARYRELSDTVMSNERFNAMMPDEQNAILDEMQSLRERIDRANQIMQDMSIEQDMGDDVPMPGDENTPAEDDGYHGMKAMNHPGDDAPAPTDEDVPEQVKRNGKLKEMLDAGDDVPEPTDEDAPLKQKQSEGMTAEKAEDRMISRQNKREKRKTVAKAETAFKRLGYDIAGAIVDNYEDAEGIIEDDKLASRVESDINKYVEDNNIQFYVDNTAKLMAMGQLKPENVGLRGEDLKQANLLADMYRQFEEVSGNSIREQGKKNTNIVNEELDDIFRGYDWFTEPDKKQKRLREQLQLSLANPEQVMRDVFGDAKIVKDEDGSERLLNVAERLNEYIIRPTIENSARARRQTNQMVSGLRDLGLTEAESGITQIFAEYSDIEESKSKKPTISESDLRYMLMSKKDADGFAEQIARKEYGTKETKEKKEFRDSIVEQLQNEINVNEAKARQRALRDHKAKGGTNASWNALSENERNAKIDAAYKTVTDESIGRIVNGTKELRKLLDDMYEAINAISVIHGAAPIPFRRGYMPHSHRQTEELQKWFNDHIGGLNVTPVQDLPTDIAGKTADRKPNKRWFSHAQQRTGPRTTWDALGNIEDYLRIANDTIYHMDDIRKMRVLERYIRGIYSAARGVTGEEQRTRVRNDVMQRLHGEDLDLVFLGLQPPEKKQKISDEDMDLSQMTTFVTWLTNYTNDLAAKQIFNRDIESFAGRKVNNLANTLTSWSSRTMMQYNISSNLKQLSQLGTVSGDVGARISKDAAAMTLRSMQNLGNGTNELEQKYHISERSTFLAEKEAIEEATFASDKDLTEKQKTDRQRAKDIWDYAWSMTDTTMSRYAVYAYFMEGMQRGMDDTEALHYADTKARNILASRMKGSSPLIFQSKNPILRMFTLFQREPLAAWQDILKTMPREYSEMKTVQGEKTAKEQITKRITGRLLGAGIVNTVYATVLGLGTPAMFDILGEPLRALLDKLWKEITPDEEDDITFKEMAERYISTLGDEIADDIPFANVVSLIFNTYAGTEFESRLALNAPDLRKIFGLFGLGGKAAWNGAKLLWSDDAEDIELLEELSTIPGQIPVAILDMITEIVGTAAPAGNQIRKSAKGLIAVLRSGEYTKDGKLKYEVGGVGDSIRAVLLGSSNTRAGQEWIASGFDSLSKTETEAYKALIGAGVSEKRARQYVERVAEAEKVADETQAQAEARMIDRMTGLDKQQKAELYYDMVATDNQRAAVDAAVGAGAKIDDAVETARAIRDSSKKLDRLTALQASDMDTDAREEMYLAMVATKVKDADGNVIGTEDDDLLEALYATGLDFDDFLDAKQMQSVLNANESLTANQRASRFLAWTASQGYTDAQAEAIGENFGFSSGFRVKSETYQKIVDSGVTAENAVKVTDAIAGKTKTADKINAVWSTGLSGNQLDLAVKSVLSEKAYERYRIVVDANIPLEIYTWALLNADQDAEGEKGHGSVNNTERELILSQLALPRKDLSALWLALGGSEKSNPYSGTPKVSVPKVKVPKIEMPKI